MLVVALIAFTLFRFVGDPVNQMVGIETIAGGTRGSCASNSGLNDPVVVQFPRFVGNAARFDFGISYQFKQPVIDLITDRLPATLELSFVSALFSLAGRHPDGRLYGAAQRIRWLSDIFLDRRR